MLKRERKAAQRELRKDAKYLARVQLEEELANDADRCVLNLLWRKRWFLGHCRSPLPARSFFSRERVKRFESLVAVQQGELNKLDRAK